jgi:hypothetical protein
VTKLVLVTTEGEGGNTTFSSSSTGVDSTVMPVVPGMVSIKAVVVASTNVLKEVDSATVCSVRVNVTGEVLVIVKLLRVVVKMDLEMLSPPEMVDPGMIEMSVDVIKMVLRLVIIESGWVVVTSKNEKLAVIVLIIVDAGRVVVNVVMKVSTVEHPEGTIDGPAGKHAAKPGYWDEYASSAIRKSRTVCGTYP